MLRILVKFVAITALALGSLLAHAGLTTLNYSGGVSGYWSLPIVQDDFPIGTPVTVTLTYDNSFVGLPAPQFYLGMAPTMSGLMTLGSNQYTLTGMSLTYFSYGATAADPSPNYGFHVTGTGPATDDGEVFSGMDLYFNPFWPGIPTLIGFGNPNWMVADNGYLTLFAVSATYQYSVPAPGTLGLALAGLLLLGSRLRRGGAVSRGISRPHSSTSVRCQH